MDEDDIAGGDGVGVDLDGVGAVFLGVGLADGLRRELAGLADGDEARAEPAGDGCGGDDAPLPDADYLGDALVFLPVAYAARDRLRAGGVLEQCGYVEELDSLQGEIGHDAEIIY